MQKFISKDTVKSLFLTVIFNTLIALVLMIYMDENNHNFFDVFLIAQFIGLSICIFVIIGMNIVEKKPDMWQPIGIIAGLTTGIASGAERLRNPSIRRRTILDRRRSPWPPEGWRERNPRTSCSTAPAAETR